ncbi:peptidase M23 [Shimia sp. SDUM112013]|uniref:peptidase M23 n=1 Tax=Shimia sp. SDUM112013 TaxID=3136160 RepID=UPI0032ED14EE
MKHLMPAAVVLFAVPAFAHEGAHMHPHGNDPSWAALMVALLVGAGAATFLWSRNK